MLCYYIINHKMYIILKVLHANMMVRVSMYQAHSNAIAHKDLQDHDARLMSTSVSLIHVKMMAAVLMIPAHFDVFVCQVGILYIFVFIFFLKKRPKLLFYLKKRDPFFLVCCCCSNTKQKSERIQQNFLNCVFDFLPVSYIRVL